MNIVQIVPEMDIGGVEQGTYDLAKGLLEKGHKSIVISSGGRFIPELKKVGVQHYTLPVHCKSPIVIAKMVKKVKAKFPKESIYFVLGGFHLMESDNRAIEIVAENFKNMGIIKVGPTHCSGPEAEKIFKEEYGKKFILVKTGQILNV